MLKLADEDPEKGLQIVPGHQGKKVPSACTIVIIAGFRLIQSQQDEIISASTE